jgi:hypothetical protein
MDELHRVENFAFAVADIKDPAYRRVRNLAREANLVHDALAPVRVGGMDQFQGDRKLEDQIVGPPHLAHAARSEARDHSISAGQDIPGHEAGSVVHRLRLDGRRGECGVPVHLTR